MNHDRQMLILTLDTVFGCSWTNIRLALLQNHPLVPCVKVSIGTAFLWGSGACQAPCVWSPSDSALLCQAPGAGMVSGAGLLTHIVSVLLTSQELWWCLQPYLTVVLLQMIIWFNSDSHCLGRSANDYSRYNITEDWVQPFEKATLMR